jgi:quercetin dioxygenase-like cupin family protein
MNTNKRNWSDISAEPISEQAIRTLHSPQKNYKLYVNTYEAGKSFSANAGHAFVLYVLAGSCKTTLEGKEVSLHASEFVTLEKGSHAFDVSGKEELKLVKVFSLS